VATSISSAGVTRTDLGRVGDLGDGRRWLPPAAQALVSAAAGLEDMIPMRMEVCVRQPAAPLSARVRLFGARDLTKFDLWIGEAGLQCATRGNVEGVRCDPMNPALRLPSATLMSGGEAAGRGSAYLEWNVESIAPATIVYLTEKVTDLTKQTEQKEEIIKELTEQKEKLLEKMKEAQESRTTFLTTMLTTVSLECDNVKDMRLRIEKELAKSSKRKRED